MRSLAFVLALGEVFIMGGSSKTVLDHGSTPFPFEQHKGRYVAYDFPISSPFHQGE
jgi:hypothetical protein